MFTPSQVSEILKVPSSTVRRWAARFEPFLAPRLGKKRSYTSEDLDTFARIQAYLKQGFSLNNIDMLLPVMEPVPEAGTSLLSLTECAKTIRTLDDMLQEMAVINADQDVRIARLESHLDWYTTPWYKRMGRKPPIV